MLLFFRGFKEERLMKWNFNGFYIFGGASYGEGE